jgi:leader peptidase (prepilin peptidase) / N-methyltransferase
VASFSDHPAGAAHSLVVVKRPRAAYGSKRDDVRRLARHPYAPALAVAAPLAGLAFVRFGAGGHFVVAAFVIAILTVLSVIDIRERRLPNRIIFPSLAVVFVARTALEPDRALEWMLAGLGAALVLFLPRLLYPRGLGMGDVKLALLLGVALGSAVMTALIIACFGAGAYAALLFARYGGTARGRDLPFGPFLAIGAVAAMLL